MKVPTQGANGESFSPNVRKLLRQSRFGILSVAIVFGLIATLSIVGFVGSSAHLVILLICSQTR